ncbi:MAG: hydroxylase [Rhizobacter sp.]|nr:hydroxylase [Rhizobacter sp.]
MIHSHPILVTGAAGKVGAIGPSVVRDLLSRGFKVRAMVRREDERAEALRQLGADVVVGSLLDLHDVHRAVEGCKRVYFSMSVDSTYLEATTNVAAVCKHHGVDAFVNMSQMTLSQMSVTETTDSPQHKQHWLAEQVLQWSGLPVVVLRPTAFMDVFFLRFGLPTVKRKAALMLPFGTGKTSPIAASDVARCVSAVLADPKPHIGKIYDLTGPASNDLAEIARQYTRALGREISYVDVPVGPWEERLRHSDATPHLAAHLIAMAALHRQNRYDRYTDNVERLTGQPPMSVEAFVRQHAEAFAPE